MNCMGDFRCFLIVSHACGICLDLNCTFVFAYIWLLLPYFFSMVNLSAFDKSIALLVLILETQTWLSLDIKKWSEYKCDDILKKIFSHVFLVRTAIVPWSLCNCIYRNLDWKPPEVSSSPSYSMRVGKVKAYWLAGLSIFVYLYVLPF